MHYPLGDSEGESGATPPNKSTLVLKPSPDVVGRMLNQETVLIQLKTSQVYVLSQTAARLWTLIGEGKSLDEIRQTLLEEYDVEEERLNREIDETVSELSDRKLLGESDVD
jgi:hypothetical protein